MVLSIAKNRLTMRYASGGSFTFSRIQHNASDEGMFQLANSIASLQNERPAKILRVVTRVLS
jgi:hypothetical protein